MYSEQRLVVVHVHNLLFNGVECVRLPLQSVATSAGNVFEMKLTVRFKEVEDCEEERNEAASHNLVLWRKSISLGFGALQENIFRDPLAHKIGQFGSDMKTMPYAAECVEVVIS